MEKLELETFKPLEGDAFHVTPTHEGQAFDVVLAAVEPTPYGDPSAYNGRRMPFSLLFHAEDETFVPQQICTMAHAEAGEVPLFIVPLGPKDGVMRYEAVIA